VSVGDLVRVRGIVSEFNGLTEISPGQAWFCSSGHSVTPTALTLPLVSLDAFEAYEGMLVTLPQALFTSEFYDFDRYGQIVLTTTAQ
jgi:predicted extracellular nuclease